MQIIPSHHENPAKREIFFQTKIYDLHTEPVVVSVYDH